MKQSLLLLACYGHALLHGSPPLLQHRNKIVIPALPASGGVARRTEAEGGSSGASARSEYAAHQQLHPSITSFLHPESAAELQRAQQLDAFQSSTDKLTAAVWRDSKTHLKRQKELVKELGIDGAVREVLQPTRVSFREELRQRPLDRAILEEIYQGLHGRRIERKLKRGVSWEHWITKGDGTAPVFNTSSKAQQSFAFGGSIRLVKTATHPQQFPVLLHHKQSAATPSSSPSLTSPPTKATGKRKREHHRHVHRELLLPEVAFIGRTSSGKSSLINAIVNAMITPYGHLQGTTDALRFYSIADRFVIVDCPGYGYYNPMGTPAIDAENAVKAMRAYLKTGRRSSRSHEKAATKTTSLAASPAAVESTAESPILYQPRQLQRVFLCVSARGMQHTDYEYCNFLESNRIPFSVVITKTDAAPIRFLARLTDYTRSELLRYTQCKEILLTSALRIAGIDKMQELISSFAVTEDPLHGATVDFHSIV